MQLFFVIYVIFEGSILFLCLIESSSFGGFSDVSPWLDYASQPEYCLSDAVTLSKYDTDLEAPSVHLLLMDDMGFDFPVSGLSDFYSTEFCFFLIGTHS